MDNTERFTGRAAAYDRYRMRYPAAEVLSVLCEWCGLTADWVVADVGAGTGMLAEVFLAAGCEVIAVEPNEEMRQACARLQARDPRLRVVDATAEETSLQDGSVDLVAAGRAFHWFDPVRSVAEFRRILRPGGWLALVAIARTSDETEQGRAYETLLVEHGTDYTYVRGGYRVHERLDEVFPGIPLLHREIQSSVRWNSDEFVGQAMSTSVAPLPGHPEYEGMQEALKGFFECYAVDQLLTVPVSCWISCVRLR